MFAQHFIDERKMLKYQEIACLVVELMCELSFSYNFLLLQKSQCQMKRSNKKCH